MRTWGREWFFYVPPEPEQRGAAAEEQTGQNDLYGGNGKFLSAIKSDVPNSSKIQNTVAGGRSNNPPSNQNATSKVTAPA